MDATQQHKFERQADSQRCATCGGARNIKAHGAARTTTARPVADGTFTEAQVLRRLKALARQARYFAHQPANVRVEVGTRTVHVHVASLPCGAGTKGADRSYLYADGEDLEDNVSLAEAARYYDDYRKHGAVVHLYVFEPSTFANNHMPELMDVGIGWLGTATDEPVWLG